MDRVMSREDLSELLDQVTREITQREAGIILSLKDSSPKEMDGEVCSVFITFNRGMDTSLSICADTSMFVRLACGMMQTDNLSPRDVEDVAKEYLNILAGHVLSRLFQATKMSARFSVPSFCRGQCVMKDSEAHITLNYAGDRNERVQLVHHRPFRI